MLGIRASPTGSHVLVLLRAAPSEIWGVRYHPLLLPVQPEGCTVLTCWRCWLACSLRLSRGGCCQARLCVLFLHAGSPAFQPTHIIGWHGPWAIFRNTGSQSVLQRRRSRRALCRRGCGCWTCRSRRWSGRCRATRRRWPLPPKTAGSPSRARPSRATGRPSPGETPSYMLSSCRGSTDVLPGDQFWHRACQLVCVGSLGLNALPAHGFLASASHAHLIGVQEHRGHWRPLHAGTVVSGAAGAGGVPGRAAGVCTGRWPRRRAVGLRSQGATTVRSTASSVCDAATADPL